MKRPIREHLELSGGRRFFLALGTSDFAKLEKENKRDS